MNPNPPPPPPPPSQPPPSGQPYGQPLETTTWWQRNKKWALPVGCLGLAVVLGCCGLLGVGAYGAKKGFEGFAQVKVEAQASIDEATQRIQEHPAVKEAVGDPVTVGAPTNPGVAFNNGRREYRYDLPVSGPNGQAVVHGRSGAGSSKEPMTLEQLDLETAEGTRHLLE